MSLFFPNILCMCFVYIAPPGPIPNDLRVTTICATTAELEWDQPEDVGREDFYYNISRSNPDSDESIIVNPHYADDSDAVKYTVTGLRPGTIYTFSVCVHNGVSEHDDANAKLRVVSTQGTTKPGSKSPLAMMLIDIYNMV